MFRRFSLFVAVCLFASNVLAQPTPIQIRMSAAAFGLTNKNYPPQQLDDRAFVMNAAYDVVFRATVYDQNSNYFMAGPGGGTVLFASGLQQYRSHSGNNECTGVLTFNSTHPVPGSSATQIGPLKILRIPGPHFSRNAGSVATLMDESQDPAGVCRVPRYPGGIPGGSTVTSTYAFTPNVAVIPEDANPLGAANVRINEAVVQFDVRNLPQVIPFTYKMEATDVINGIVFTRWKLVWFGQIDIRVDNGTLPPPIDPNTLWGYVPPVGENPPPDPSTPNNGPIIQNEMGIWLEGILGRMIKSVKDVQKRFDAIQEGRNPFTVASRMSREPAGRTVVRGGARYNKRTNTLEWKNVSPNPPIDGTLEVHVVFRGPRASSKNYTPPVPKAALDTKLTAAKSSTFKLKFDSSSRNYLKKGDPASVYLVVQYTPANGGPAVKKWKRFSVQRRED